MSEQNTEQSIKVRQITDVHSNWSYQGELENGKFSYQLILDNGAEEALIMPTADDAKVLRDLIHDADTLYWDTEKEVIIFGKIDCAADLPSRVGRHRAWSRVRDAGPFVSCPYAPECVEGAFSQLRV